MGIVFLEVVFFGGWVLAFILTLYDDKRISLWKEYLEITSEFKYVGTFYGRKQFKAIRGDKTCWALIDDNGYCTLNCNGDTLTKSNSRYFSKKMANKLLKTIGE